ncbi:MULTISPECIES: pyrroline-5-carboxylate reductase [unclassified Beijerinckia]|uniref:pyrroline-5-carboxylate reductase n=1 Tax=unclassified Beijerinckia TaxID=2638183 RepID=UPI00089A4FB1|nr:MULTISPECIES: pyrroline-5-carboxylate reductase [unclassified Beijerinckia]MDH7799503.1 pyrroline-5-carboxylate reductase [Beijerinckia sp. GAS462]SED52695.1 pyrroline-5-carboxylate reductase [Beijerinckia sp. 28-YEA-48]
MIDPSALPATLVLFGAGKMGSAMLRGWLALGMDGHGVTIVDPHPAADLLDLAKAHGILVNPPVGTITAPDALVLAVKPQTLDAAAADIAPLVTADTLVLSIMAGKTIANIAARLPEAKAIVRAMPNTPAAVGRGITGAAANAGVTPSQHATASALLAAIGAVEWLDREDWIDAVTAVSGSGPAYVFYLAECMAKAGEAAGLPADLAMRLARATVEGSGELMFTDAATTASQLRVNVTSPGGTTAAALDVLMAKDGLEPLMAKAIAAAKRRAGELSG